MTPQTKALIYTPELHLVTEIYAALRKNDARPDLLPAVLFALAEPVEARTEDVRDWILIGGLLCGAGLALLAYLTDMPLIYALAAVAFAVVAVGYVAWCGVRG